MQNTKFTVVAIVVYAIHELMSSDIPILQKKLGIASSETTLPFPACDRVFAHENVTHETKGICAAAFDPFKDNRPFEGWDVREQWVIGIWNIFVEFAVFHKIITEDW
jgi:hypothetical protein